MSDSKSLPMSPEYALRRRRHASADAFHRTRRWLDVRLGGPLARLTRAQRESLLAGQFEASRAMFMGMLATGAMLLVVLAVMEHMGWMPGIGYPVWMTALGGGTLVVAAYLAINAARLWARVMALLAYGIILAALVSFPVSELSGHLLIRSELFNLFILAALMLSTRRVTILAVLGFIAAVTSLRLNLYGPPWSGPGIYWLVVAMQLAFGLVLRRFRLDLAAQALVMGERLRDEARTDALTGLANRAGWESAAHPALEHAIATGADICCVFLDVDHFKRVNDTYGHAAGDEILRMLGSALARIRPERAIAARLGGEEFVLLVPGADIEQARAFAELARADLAAASHAFGVTASAGIALHEAGESLHSLMQRADAALYAAKRAGRNRAVVARSPDASAPLPA